MYDQGIENPRVGGSIPSLATIYTSNFIPIVLISAKFLVAAMECGRQTIIHPILLLQDGHNTSSFSKSASISIVVRKFLVLE